MAAFALEPSKAAIPLTTRLRTSIRAIKQKAMPTRSAMSQLLVASAAASIGAALTYLIAGQFSLRTTEMSKDALIWLVLISALTMPVTLFSSMFARLFVGYSGYLKFALAIAGFLIIPSVSALGFIAYMEGFSPATNWQKGWWLPVVASIASILLTWAMAQKNGEVRNVRSPPKIGQAHLP